MSITAVIIMLLCLGLIAGGILLLKKSAKKFHLTGQQLKDIKARNQQLEKEEQEEK
ncbi:DUF2897 family protein [Thalassomonas haliotis]|uniref:DUF2897 family protein n=1 Tax=Thalassomonas haliotis TaxID=485448 RepID=A0ABY7VL24_9GAMM|nr:DUF2897 family protein [Thalassomonas haliotis]WDE13377.1 DUF2897 family protein [Thalassomonas haliotis]